MGVWPLNAWVRYGCISGRVAGETDGWRYVIYHVFSHFSLNERLGLSRAVVALTLAIITGLAVASVEVVVPWTIDYGRNVRSLLLISYTSTA